MPLPYLLSLLLFLGPSLTAANKCPDPDDLQPYCSCWPASGPEGGPPKTICQNVEQVVELKRVFSASGDYPFVDFEVNYCVLSYFPASALKEKAVKELLLRDTRMVGLFDRIPEHNTKLNMLTVVNSRIFRGIEWPLLKNLNNLTKLFFEGIIIRSLGKEFMDNIPKGITHFALALSKLSRLDDRVFARLTELISVSLNAGNITNLKRSMFPASNVIENLDFNANQLSELPHDIFSDMPKLKYVTLGDNLFKTISESVFNKIDGKNVEIRLLRNSIKCDCKIRWILRKEWKNLEAKCESPSHFKDKALVGGLSEGDLDYCDDRF